MEIWNIFDDSKVVVRYAFRSGEINDQLGD